MDDDGTPVAGGFQYRIHAGCHFGATPGGVETMVQVPHVADDNGRFLCLPVLHFPDRVIAARRRFCFDLLAQAQFQVCLRSVTGKNQRSTGDKGKSQKEGGLAHVGSFTKWRDRLPAGRDSAGSEGRCRSPPASYYLLDESVGCYNEERQDCNS